MCHICERERERESERWTRLRKTVLFSISSRSNMRNTTRDGRKRKRKIKCEGRSKKKKSEQDI
jgi:hypothetical protein